MSLVEYRSKRNFAETSEPPGKKGRSKSAALSFVVQKHDATRLHYDLRLEMDGVLKSWAVPKGFPTSKGDKRLAVQVEDHPLEYGDFEGTIPEGNYGAGTVMLWDKGTYRVSGDDPMGALNAGKLHLFFNGAKLQSDWTLVRMRPRPGVEKPEWLLLKSSTDVPPFSAKAEKTSVVSGRTLEQIADATDRKEWQSNRATERSVQSTWKDRIAKAAAEGRATKSQLAPASASESQNAKSPPRQVLVLKAQSKTRPASDISAHDISLAKCPKADPGFVEPMKARVTAETPSGDDWTYEIKFDGVRALAIKRGSEVELFSRLSNSLNTKYPEIAEALSRLPVQQAVLDGEIVALDSEGRSSFQLLQSFHTAVEKPPIAYYVFDILNYDGRDVRSLPLERRKELASGLVKAVSDPVRFSPSMEAQPDKVLQAMKARGLEGLVAKRAGSAYESGKRSGSWVKYKWSNEQEFVIGGYTEPQGSRTRFGAIIVGYYEGSRLLYAGKVGTGFDQRLLDSLYSDFQELKIAKCPFSNLPEKRVGRGGGLTASEMRRCTWLEPRLVCQVRFAEWTWDGKLRQPSFLGLREDKAARDVIREKAGGS